MLSFKFCRNLGNPENRHLSHIPSIQFSPNGNRIASVSGDGVLKIWKVDVSELEFSLSYNSVKKNLNDVAWIDDRKLVTVSEDGNVQVWDSVNRNPVTFKGHNGIGFCCAANSDNKIASGSMDGTLRLWDIRKPNCLQNSYVHDGPVTAVNFSTTGMLVTSGFDGLINVWNSTSLKRETTCIPIGATGRHVFSVRFVVDDKFLLASVVDNGKSNIELWNLSDSKDPRRIKTYTGHKNDLYSLWNNVIICNSTKYIYSGSEDSKIYFWNFETEEPAGIIPVEVSGTSPTSLATDSFTSESQNLIAYSSLQSSEPVIRIHSVSQ